MAKAPTLPPADKTPIVTVNIRVRESLRARIDAVCAQTGHTRHRVIVTFLTHSLDLWESEHLGSPEGNGGGDGDGGRPADD